MKAPVPPDPAQPPERGFGELRCRRYLFDRPWWDEDPRLAAPPERGGASAPATPGAPAAGAGRH